ncbi:MAG: hypothetical protein N2045_13945, partial [Fimbriimonadales bacterium]|nr:hypothetical protein [Fimbriimonadales bacterium]
AVKAKLAQSLGMPAYEKDAFYRAIAEPERFEQAFWLLAQLGTNLWLHDRAIAPTRPPLESVFWQGAALMLAEKLGYPEIRKERVQIAQGYKPWTDTLPYTERLLAREYVKALLRRLMENDPSERRLVEITRQQSESGIVESAEKSAQSVQSVQMNSESDGQMDSYPPTTAQSVHHPPTENEFKSGDLGGLGGLDGCFSDSTKTLSPPDAPLDEAERLRQVIRDWMTTHEPFPITINGRRIPASFWGYAVKHASLAQLQEWVAQLPAQSRR